MNTKRTLGAVLLYYFSKVLALPADWWLLRSLHIESYCCVLLRHKAPTHTHLDVGIFWTLKKETFDMKSRMCTQLHRTLWSVRNMVVQRLFALRHWDKFLSIRVVCFLIYGCMTLKFWVWEKKEDFTQFEGTCIAIICVIGCFIYLCWSCFPSRRCFQFESQRICHSVYVFQLVTLKMIDSRSHVPSKKPHSHEEAKQFEECLSLLQVATVK